MKFVFFLVLVESSISNSENMKFPGASLLIIMSSISCSILPELTSATVTPFSRCSTSIPLDCCDIPYVDARNVTIDYMVHPTGDELRPWQLNALIEWPPISGTANYSYSVDFHSTIEASGAIEPNPLSYRDYQICPQIGFSYYEFSKCPTESSFPIETSDTKMMFHDLLFGFAYYFQIQVIENGNPAGLHYCFTACEECGNTDAPDCLAATGDVDFCRDQPIAVASIPLNLTASFINGGRENGRYLLISWEEPWKSTGGVIESYTLKIRKNRINEFRDKYVIVSTNRSHAVPYKTLEAELEDENPYNTTFDISVETNVNLKDVGIPRKSGIVTAQAAIVSVNASMLIAVLNEMEMETMPVSMTTTRPTRPVKDSTATSPEEFPYVIVIGSSVGAIFILLAFLNLFACCYCKMKKNETTTTQPIFVPESNHATEKKLAELILPEFRQKEIPDLDHLRVGDKPIGSGQYGKVYAGSLRKEGTSDEFIKVAVKTTRDDLSAAMKEEFLDEIRLMLDIGQHPNIMQVLACKTVSEPYYLVTEYMQYGSLKDYFAKCRKPAFGKQNPAFILTEYMKLAISHQICEGMIFLSDTRYFHGDLAARNILLNENLEVKISDFGLSNDIYQRGYFRLPQEDKRPVKWYSPEANIHGRCSTEGDVWSYGVVLYEIYTVGGEPYPGMNPREVIIQIKNGYRMEKPEGCPDKIYGIMLKCWQYEAKDRPQFSDIGEMLREYIEKPELLFGQLDNVKREEFGVSVEFTYDETASISSNSEVDGGSIDNYNPLQLRLSLPVSQDIPADRYSMASFMTDDSLNGEATETQIHLEQDD